MAATIPNLWPDIRMDVLPPVVILKAQANKLGELTQGLIEAEVTTVTGEKDFVSHRLDLIAPAVDGRRTRILVATHRADFYPITLDADCYRPKTRTIPTISQQIITMQAGHTVPTTWPPADDWRPVAGDQEEFLKRLGEVFRSMEVRAAIETMIALSNLKSEGSESDSPAEVG